MSSTTVAGQAEADAAAGEKVYEFDDSAEYVSDDDKGAIHI